MKKVVVLLAVVSCLIILISFQMGSGFVRNADFNTGDYNQIISSSNQLGFDLLRGSNENRDGNIFISPASLFLALSMIYNGADGITKEEMSKVLHTEGKELNKANASLISLLQHDIKDGQLNIANSIWLNKQYHFQDDFSKNSRRFYNAKIQEIDMTNSQTPKIINEWVKDSTHNKITRMIKADDIDPNVVAFLLNAIYFKGDWMYRFDKNLTTKQPFYLQERPSKDIPLMTLNEKLDYMENGDFQAVSLPYAGGKMSMKVFLPNQDSSLVEFQKKLTFDNWEKWNSDFQEKEGTVLLPKFHAAYEAEWSEQLKKLGMKTAFDPESALFTKMIKEKGSVWVSKIKQKTFINIDEEGSEAAAVTTEQMKTKSAPLDGPFRMEVNRPFFMVIIDNQTGAILFMGLITNP